MTSEPRTTKYKPRPGDIAGQFCVIVQGVQWDPILHQVARGWHLPGGLFTTNRTRAIRTCDAMDRAYRKALK